MDIFHHHDVVIVIGIDVGKSGVHKYNGKIQRLYLLDQVHVEKFHAHDAVHFELVDIVFQIFEMRARRERISQKAHVQFRKFRLDAL